MCTSDEHFLLHSCGWDQARLVDKTPALAASQIAASQLAVNRRQMLVGMGGLTAAALLTACTSPGQPQQPGATGAPTAPAASAVEVTPAKLGKATDGLDEIQVWQEEFYKDLHRHPDVWPGEARTAEKITRKLEEIGVDQILQIGGGVVAIVRNGDGRKVLFRSDIDALPVTEATDLEYKSVEEGKMHACGHDAHVACGLGAVALMARNRGEWSGTYLALFQRGEETAKGARAMVDDGLVDKVGADRPDVCLAQHVLTAPQSGHVASRAGAVLSAGDSLRITVFGKGSHGSMPHLGVDPAVLASSIVLRLQAIVSRELAPGQFGVVTVGAIKVGNAPNVISDRAELLVNVRAYDNAVRDKILASIERIVRGESAASGSPQEPTIENIASYPITVNDAKVHETVNNAFIAAFGAERVHELAPVPASEDFSIIPDAFGVPYLFFGNGAFLPGSPVVGNHNPTFAPAMQPTIRTGTEAAVAASLAYLGKA